MVGRTRRLILCPRLNSGLKVEQLSQLLGKQLGQLFYSELLVLIFKVDKALGSIWKGIHCL